MTEGGEGGVGKGGVRKGSHGGRQRLLDGNLPEPPVLPSGQLRGHRSGPVSVTPPLPSGDMEQEPHRGPQALAAEGDALTFTL